MSDRDISVPGMGVLTPLAEPTGALTPVQMAMLGVRARQVGLEEADVVALIGLVEDVARSAAETAAKQATLAVTPKLLEFVEGVHRGAAYRIARDIGRLPRGILNGDHTSCINAAYAVGHGPASRYDGR